MRDQTDPANLVAKLSGACTTCSEPGWSTYYDAEQARRARIPWWQSRLPGPDSVLTISRCDNEGEDVGMYHLGRPYLIAHNPETRIVRCPACELFAWRTSREDDQCHRCLPRATGAPGEWWEDLLGPNCGLIRQDRRMRAALCPPSIAIPDVLRSAVGPVNTTAGLFVQGVGHCLQMAAVPADTARIRALTEAANGGQEPWERHDMWWYAALLQGIAAGQLPLRPYWDVHALLQRVVVPSTVSELLARVQVNASLSYLWRAIGLVL